MDSIFLLAAIISAGPAGDKPGSKTRNEVVTFNVQVQEDGPRTGEKEISVGGKIATYIGVLDRKAELPELIDGKIVVPPTPGYPLEFYETSDRKLYVYRDELVPTFEIDTKLVNPDHLKALKAEFAGSQGRNISTFHLDKDGNVIGPGGLVVIKGNNLKCPENIAPAVSLQTSMGFTLPSPGPFVYNVPSEHFSTELGPFEPSVQRQQEAFRDLARVMARYPELAIKNLTITNQYTGTTLSISSAAPTPVIASRPPTVTATNVYEAAAATVTK